MGTHSRAVAILLAPWLLSSTNNVVARCTAPFLGNAGQHHHNQYICQASCAYYQAADAVVAYLAFRNLKSGVFYLRLYRLSLSLPLSQAWYYAFAWRSWYHHNPS